LTVGFNYPGTIDFLKTPSLTNLLQPLVYAVLFFLAVLWSIKTSNTTLRKDAKKITAINAYIIRGCFFSVLLIGLIDASIAWLRVEGLLTTLFNESTASALLRSGFIGPKIHLPLIALGFLIAIFSRTLGFLWLALMIVGAELLIVISRFVFSYEQTLMGDLVRYWYAALFLFASAYTLFDDGHVRVDVLYSTFKERTKGKVNAYGVILLGMTTSITIFVICLWSKQAIVNSPVMNFEVSQNGTAGMYIKYQMAAFLLIFAITMQIQFVSYLFEAVADLRNEPDKRKIKPISH
jgi:TRAP-type mannitol/chloroaromatic compound transport system permease small subunit